MKSLRNVIPRGGAEAWRTEKARRHERLDADPKVLPLELWIGGAMHWCEHRDPENKCGFLDSLRWLGMTLLVIPSAVEESAVLRGSAFLRVSA